MTADTDIARTASFQFRPTESGLAAAFQALDALEKLVSIPSHGIWSCSKVLLAFPVAPTRFQFRPTESGLAAL